MLHAVGFGRTKVGFQQFQHFNLLRRTQNASSIKRHPERKMKGTQLMFLSLVLEIRKGCKRNDDADDDDDDDDDDDADDDADGNDEDEEEE